MTDKPMTPREDVEERAGVLDAMAEIPLEGENTDPLIEVFHSVGHQSATMLRALLAERDAALVVIAKYRDALQSCGCTNCVAPIKETPDA